MKKPLINIAFMLASALALTGCEEEAAPVKGRDPAMVAYNKLEKRYESLMVRYDKMVDGRYAIDLPEGVTSGPTDRYQLLDAVEGLKVQARDILDPLKRDMRQQKKYITPSHRDELQQCDRLEMSMSTTDITRRDMDKLIGSGYDDAFTASLNEMRSYAQIIEMFLVISPSGSQMRLSDFLNPFVQRMNTFEAAMNDLERNSAGDMAKLRDMTLQVRQRYLMLDYGVKACGDMVAQYNARKGVFAGIPRPKTP